MPIPPFDLVQGLGVTLRNLLRRPTTVQYPEQKRPMPERTRWRHVLHRYENGLERCVGCFLCAGACPADAIYIESAENTAENRVSPGERYARVYEINMLRCIFCGYCEDACPTDAVKLHKFFELADTSRQALVYDKERLLQPTPDTESVFKTPEQGVYDGTPTSAASVGLGDLPTVGSDEARRQVPALDEPA
jgi:NADH-quinone oxidoreductase subunit I